MKRIENVVIEIYYLFDLNLFFYTRQAIPKSSFFSSILLLGKQFKNKL